MKTVKIQIENGKPAKIFDFIAWKNDRHSFYARPHNGKPRVVALTPALPETAKGRVNPFPGCAPKAITPCRLLPPRILEPWEFDQTQDKTNDLFLTPEDEQPLAARLKGIQGRLSTLLDQKRTKLVDIRNPKERALKARELEEDELRAETHLKTTLEQVNAGDLGIRDDYLIEQWAQREKIDLEKMSQQRIELLDWLEKAELLSGPENEDDGIRGSAEFIKHLAKREPFCAYRHFDKAMRDKWPDGIRDEIWGLLSQVSHLATFEDGQTACLIGCKVRGHLRLSETNELGLIAEGPMDPESKQRLDQAKHILENRIAIPCRESGLSNDEKQLFNLLTEPNPNKTGFALSYREIANRMGISRSTVMRQKRKLVESHPNLNALILQERQGNDRTPHPDALSSSRSGCNESPDFGSVPQGEVPPTV